MEQVDPNSTRRKGLWATLVIAAAAGAGAVTIALPATSANADPPPPPPGTTTAPPPANPNAAPDAAPGPADPNAPPQPADPNAVPPPVGPNAPDAGRVDNPPGGFSFVIPAGWVESDATHLDYGSALLSKQTGPGAPGQPPPVANDTRIVLGRLDQKLYASAEPDNAKAATRLASDMGEFYMPYPGTRINQETTPLKGDGVAGSASYYEVKFSDTSKPNGQIWAGVVGTTNAATPQRWFVVWLGTANDPVDKAGATTLAQSVRPSTPPPAPAAPPPAPGAPAPAPGAPPPAPAPGAPPPAPAPGAPPPAPAPGAPPPAPAQAPAGGQAPGSAPAPQTPVAT